MNIGSIAKIAEKFIIDNSPTVLTAMSAVGTITTAYLAGSAGVQAGRILEQTIDELTLREKAAATWKLFLPAAGTGALTLTAVFSANHISTSRAAGLAAAYSLSERAYSEYRDKMVEKFGQKKEQEARAEIAQEQVSRLAPSTLIITGTDVLCHEAFTGRAFSSSVVKLEQAQNAVNRQLNNNDAVSLTEFYHMVGLPPTSFSDEVGWTSRMEMMELKFSGTITADGKPCISFDYNVEPIRDFYNCWD